jgi:hypothetical protein
MPRFTVKDVLLAMLLVAIGLTMVVAIRVDPPGSRNPDLNLCLFLGGMPCIGAGLAAPFHRKWVGAGIGAILAMILVTVAFSLTSKRASNPGPAKRRLPPAFVLPEHPPVVPQPANATGTAIAK